MQLHQLYKTKNMYFRLGMIYLEKFQTNDYQKTLIQEYKKLSITLLFIFRNEKMKL